MTANCDRVTYLIKKQYIRRKDETFPRNPLREFYGYRKGKDTNIIAKRHRQREDRTRQVQ